MIDQELNETTALEALRQVIDPELGCNLVDLGLIYNLDIDVSRVDVKMTLTTRGCPMHESLTYGVQRALMALPGVEEVNVEVVWDPPWIPEMMSPEGRRMLGV